MEEQGYELLEAQTISLHQLKEEQDNLAWKLIKSNTISGITHFPGLIMYRRIKT